MPKFKNPAYASTNKPLICLYQFAEIMGKFDKEEASLDVTMGWLTQVIPNALSYPAIAGVQILIPPISYKSDGFAQTRWNFTSDLLAFGEKVGSFEVCYTKKVKEDFHGPFTADEIMFFMYLTNRISSIIERLRIRRQLKLENKGQKDANTALNEVLKQIKSEQSEMAKSIQTNINKVVIPMLSSMTTSSNKHQQGMLEVVINNLKEIASPFTAKLSSEFMTLTPQELIICNLIKDGLSSKEIAQAKGLSPTTINNHRENIRRKLKLSNKKINLKSYLANNYDNFAQLLK